MQSCCGRGQVSLIYDLLVWLYRILRLSACCEDLRVEITLDEWQAAFIKGAKPNLLIPDMSCYHITV